MIVAVAVHAPHEFGHAAWKMDHAAHCEIHAQQMCTDVYSIRCCWHLCKVTGMQNFTQVSLAQCWKTFWRVGLLLHFTCICQCLG